MRRLILLRHAEAEHEALRDADRRLTARGRRDAARVGRWLAAEGFAPDRIVASSAARAVETARLAAEAAGLDARDVETDDALYLADAGTLLALAGGYLTSGALLLVAHNPGIGTLAHAFHAAAAGRGPPAGFPPASAAVVELPEGAAGRELLVRGRLAASASPDGLPP